MAVLKLLRAGSCHRVLLDGAPDFAAVRQEVLEVFPDLGSFTLKYRDEDGDLCTLATATFSDCLSLATDGQTGRTVLKLFVVPADCHEEVPLGSFPPTRSNSSASSFSASSWEEIQFEDEAAPSTDGASTFPDSGAASALAEASPVEGPPTEAPAGGADPAPPREAPAGAERPAPPSAEAEAEGDGAAAVEAALEAQRVPDYATGDRPQDEVRNTPDQPAATTVSPLQLLASSVETFARRWQALQEEQQPASSSSPSSAVPCRGSAELFRPAAASQGSSEAAAAAAAAAAGAAPSAGRGAQSSPSAQEQPAPEAVTSTDGGLLDMEKVGIVFAAFDRDGDGRLNYCESNNLQRVAWGGKLEKEVYEGLCAEQGADPSKGLGPEAAARIYTQTGCLERDFAVARRVLEYGARAAEAPQTPSSSGSCSAPSWGAALAGIPGALLATRMAWAARQRRATAAAAAFGPCRRHW